MKFLSCQAKQMLVALAFALPLASHAAIVSPGDVVWPNGFQLGQLQLPSSLAFGHTFVPPAGTQAGTLTFTDDWQFTVPASATSEAWVSSLNLSNILGISNLQIRLIDGVTGNPIQGWLQATTTPVGAQTIGVAALPSYEFLGANHPYTIQVAGTVSGISGGTYSGGLNLIDPPVPLPAALPLFLSALLPLSWLGRQRRRAGKQELNPPMSLPSGASA